MVKVAPSVVDGVPVAAEHEWETPLGNLLTRLRATIVRSVPPPRSGPVLEQLYAATNVFLFRSCVVGLPSILTFDVILWGQSNHRGLLIWSLLVLCAVSMHMRLTTLHRRPGDLTRKLAVRCATLALSAVAWGALPVLSLPPGQQEKWQALTTLLTVTVMAANAIFASPLRRIYLSFQVPLAVTAAVGLLLEGNRFAMLLAALLIYLLAATTVLHHQGNLVMVGAVQLGHDNKLLAEELSKERSELARTNHDLVEVNHQLEHQTRHDGLTGLASRSLFADRVEQALATSAGGKFKVAVLFIDIDRFKSINDSLGHDGGDALLIEVANRISACLREEDIAGRFGGDEFTVLLPQCRSVMHAITIARRIRSAIATGMDMGGEHISVTVSVGIACSQKNSQSPASLLRDADAALYQAKQNGRNRVEVFESSPVDPRAHSSEFDETELRKGFDAGQLQGWFQPEVDLFTGEITGAEALARWVHPDGVRNAGSFMHTVERSGLLDDLTNTVVKSIMAATPDFVGNLPGFRTHLNVSAKFLHNLDRIEGFIALADERQFDLRTLALEVTETAVIEDLPRASAWLQRARDAGMTVYLDDFGMGYCSLGVFAQLPVDGLKIDMSFVRQLTCSPTSRAIVRATVQLATDLDLHVIAEGVETTEQADALRDLGVRHAQGYLFSPAVAGQQFVNWLENGAPWQPTVQAAHSRR